MIAGVGADILEVPRIAAGMQKQRFRERVFTPDELAYCTGKPLQSAAGLYAAKEAAVKAAGVGFTGFWPRDVEITHDALGRPVVRPRGVFKEICDSRRVIIHVSISHTKDVAIAYAIAECVEEDHR